jgi:hypothetical protein
MTHFANHQLFRQKGHEQEDLLRFLSCQLRFIQVLGLADDRSAHEITKLLRTACPAWKSILDLTNLATLLKTAAYQSEQLAELLQVGQRGSLGSVLDSDLVRKLTSLGFARGNLHLGGPARNFFFLRLNRSARACLAISDGNTNAPHQENRKALVGLATRPNQSQTRANKTRPDRQDDQTARGPLCLKPEVAHNVPFIINLHLNLQFFSNQNNKTKPEHQSLPVLLMRWQDRANGMS